MPNNKNERKGKQTGELAEWFRALVLKTRDTARYRGFESLSLRHFLWRIA